MGKIVEKQLYLIKTCMECLDKPYKWGGNDLNGFDCSGLMEYIYKQIDIDITRTTSTQINQGIEIKNIDELKIGDLLFFGKEDNVYHVGMYIGGDKFISSTHTGDVVKLIKLSGRNDLIMIRRILI